MFFHLTLLHQQNRGRLGVAWIAATRGISHVRKAQIEEADIETLCKDITKFVCTRSNVPGQRFSLRFSSILINGVVRIYRQQAIIYLDQAYRVFNTTTSFRLSSLPASASEDRAFETPQTPITHAAKGRKRARPVENTPPEYQILSLLDPKTEHELLTSNFENMFTALPRADDFTLKENQLARNVVEEYDDGLGILGPPPASEIGVISEACFTSVLPSIREEPESLLSLERLSLLPVPELDQTPKKRRVVLSSSQSEPEIPSGNKTLVQTIAEVHAPAGEMLHIDDQPAVPRLPEKKSKERTPPSSESRKPLGLMQIDQVQQRDEQISQVEPVEIREIDHVIDTVFSKKQTDKFYFKLSARRIVYINKKSTLKLVQIASKMPSFKKDELKRLQLLNTYLTICTRESSRPGSRNFLEQSVPPISSTITNEKVDMQLTQTPEIRIERSSAGSEISQMRHQRSNEMEVSQALLSGLPLLTSTPRPSLRMASDSFRAPEVMPERAFDSFRAPEVIAEPASDSFRAPNVIAELTGNERPSKKRRLDHEELHVVSEVHSSKELVSELSPPLLEGILLNTSVDSPEFRQKEIVRKIGCVGDEALEFEDLCAPPINRLNISRLFGDLLVLGKAGYVEFKTEAGSLALKYIRKGRKLVN